MPGRPPSSFLRLPRQWSTRVRSATLHVASLAAWFFNGSAGGPRRTIRDTQIQGFGHIPAAGGGVANRSLTAGRRHPSLLAVGERGLRPVNLRRPESIGRSLERFVESPE
jgi:hypothetical protein